MRLYFLKDFDGHKEGESKFVELSLGRRYCERGIAITYQQHLDNLQKAEEAEKAEKKKKLLAKQKAEQKKGETATSKRPSGRRKAVAKEK